MMEVDLISAKWFRVFLSKEIPAGRYSKIKLEQIVGFVN